MKQHILKIPIYYETLQISVTEDFNEAVKKNHKGIDFKKYGDLNRYGALVWDESKDIELYITPDADASIIAHETVHIVNEVFKRTGMKLDYDNDEAQAYLTGWIVKEIHKVLQSK